MRMAFLLAPVASLSACMIARPTSGTKDFTDVPSEQISIDSIGCPAGTDPNRFVLKPIDPLPSLVSLNLPKGPDGQEVFAVSVGPDADNIGFDVCVDADQKVTLARIISSQFGQGSIITLSPGSTVNGLREALFDQEYDNLEIAIPFVNVKRFYDDAPQPSTQGLLIKGKGAGDASFVAAMITEKQGEEVVAAFGPLLGVAVGKLEFDDFPENPCPGSGPFEHRFKLGTASFRVKGCTVNGTSGGASPEIKEFTVNDTSPKLDAEHRAKDFTISVKSGDGVYKMFRAHHMVCEAFWLKLPHATYAATSNAFGHGGDPNISDGSGCPAQDEDTPPNNPPDTSGVAYRIRYGNAAPVEGKVKCAHFYEQCDQPGWTPAVSNGI